MAPRVVSPNEADLIPIFNGPDGVAAIYTANQTPAANVQVIYDYPPADMGTNFKGTVQKPQIRVMTSDVPNISRNDIFSVGGIVYYVKNFQADGFGVTTVELSFTGV